jgi:SpoIVB peptidase S55
MQRVIGQPWFWRGLAAALVFVLGGWALSAPAGEPDAKTYWDINDIRPGMKGTGQTVMVGTKLEEFGAVVLGVMRGVSPGRDMVLCRLTGCNLEHAGIIQGMSGSPIYIDGKLLGAVAFAWEFAKDPIAGVTPFQQMVQYVRASDKRIAAEAKDPNKAEQFRAARWDVPGPLAIDGLATEGVWNAGPSPVAGGTLGGMRAIATPLAATGFSPRALAVLSERFQPLGLAPMAGGAAPERVIREEGNKPLVPGAPLSIAMVTGDFDISGIGTVTHVEGDRVYGFGHPMFGLGTCEFPMMTGFIHTVYPRASVSMKMGSPLKVVGVVDTDVSTGVAGRIGLKPDMIPLTVRVKTGPFSEPHIYKVQMVREPNLLPNLVMAVLTNAIDTEGNLPEELTARIKATIELKGHDPIELVDTLSGPRYTGPMGAAALFSPIASIVNILVRNPMAPLRIESIVCDTEISPGRTVATIESVRLESDRLKPGARLRAFATLKPFKGERETFELQLALPDDLEEGAYEATLCDLPSSLRRRFRNEPALLEPRDLEGVIEAIRLQTVPKRSALYLHVPLPDRGLAVKGQALPNLPGSVRAVFANGRQSQEPQVRADLIEAVPTAYVVEGTHALKFTVVKDTGYSLR